MPNLGRTAKHHLGVGLDPLLVLRIESQILGQEIPLNSDHLGHDFVLKFLRACELCLERFKEPTSKDLILDAFLELDLVGRAHQQIDP